jgi:hypothetical protein
MHWDAGRQVRDMRERAGHEKADDSGPRVATGLYSLLGTRFAFTVASSPLACGLAQLELADEKHRANRVLSGAFQGSPVRQTSNRRSGSFA